MDVQTIVASIIILAALFYVASIAWRKMKAFSPKSSSCASDCGCISSAKAAKTLVKN